MMTTMPSTGSFEYEIEERGSDRDHLARILIHEDGSRTFIYYEEDTSFANPRDNDGNVCNLVVKHRDYLDMDDADYGIEDARDRWGDEHPNVERYVRMFRPDIAHYEPRWSVTGCSQSDWSYGYGYVLWSELEAAGLTDDYMANQRAKGHDMTPASLFEQELSIYQMWFEGDVYYGVHLSMGSEQFEIGPQGGYLTGYHDYDEDSCGGFLGYEDMKDIGWHFTNSPVIEELYS